jgi:hypothetical protein
VAAAGLAAVAVLGVGAGLHDLDREPAVTAPDLGALPSVAPTTTAPTTTAPTTTATAPPKAPKPKPRPPASPPPAGPVAFALPQQEVSAPVVTMGVRPDGELAIPENPRTVGWWVGSPPAGSKAGTLLAGHVDSKSQGVGAFAALREVRIGSPVVLTDVFGGTHTYTVSARRTYPKYALPRSVFHADAPLVLITCGGPFDESRGQYEDNIVVYATLS